MANYMRHTEAKKMNLVNPYPGLRPFSTRDTQIFFGRSKEIDDVVRNLMKNRFAAITGSPGSGKTSLVNAGVIPALMYNGEWIVFRTRPGVRPLLGLYSEILKKQGKEPLETPPLKSPEPEVILKALREMHKEYQAGILIFIDQFEEIFTQKISSNEEIYRKYLENYVNFLLQTVSQQDIPVHIITTIRTDFLEECSVFSEFSDLIDLHQYPLQRLMPDDITRVIMGPLEITGVGIQRELVKRMLNDVSDNPDLLPVLQHALMKTFLAWSQRKKEDSPVSIPDYEELGSIDHAISKSADEAYGQLTEEDKGYCERIFRALSERDFQNRDVCIPLKISRVSEITQVPVEKIIRITDVFRREGRGFITPSIDVPLDKNSVISVSHESLMKLWYRLDEWADEEYESVQMYLKLAEAAELYQVGKAELWRSPELESALEWYRNKKPNLAWAERYNPAFERTIVFLTTSEREFAAEEEEHFQEEKRKRILNRVLTSILAIAAIIAIVIFSLQRVQKPSSEKQETIAVNPGENNPASGDNTVNPGETNPSVKADKENEVTGTTPPSQSVQKPAENANQPVTGENGREAEQSPVIETQPKTKGENNDIGAQRENPPPVNIEPPVKDNNRKEVTAKRDATVQTEENEPSTKADEPAVKSVTLTPAKMLPVIKSLAGQSLNTSNDPSLNALLAYQAYQFNNEFNNGTSSAAIYNGLYMAMKNLRGDNYNVYEGHSNAVRTLDFLPGTSIFFSGGSDGKLLKWDLSTESNKPSTILSGRNIIDVIDVTPNGKWLLFAERGNGLNLINLSGNTGSPDQMTGSDKNIRTIAVAPDNNTVYTAGFDNYIEIWNITVRSAKKLTDTESMVNSLAVSPGGDLLAGAMRNGKTMIWKLKDNMKSLAISTNENDAVQSVRFSQGGSLLACGTLSGKIMIFRTSDLSLVNTFNGHKARVTSLEFSPDGEKLVSGSYDGTVILWDLTGSSGQPITLTDNAGFVFTVGFSPDGNYFLSGSAKEPRLVARPAKASIPASRICPLVKRDMTTDEWNKFVGSDIPYRKTCSGGGSD